MPSLGLGLGLGGVRVLGALDADAAAWFAAVEATGSVFAAGAKTAYSKFFAQLKTDGNLAPFANGMMLAFAGFTGLGGCFVPLKSRGASLPINVGFVAGQKALDGLQGNGSAYINCGIGYLAGQQNNHTAGVYGAAPLTSGIFADIGNDFSSSGSVVILERFTENVVRVSSSSNGSAFTDFSGRFSGFRSVNRTNDSQFRYLGTATDETVATVSNDMLLTNMSIFARGTTQITIRKLRLAFWGDALPNPTAFRTATNTLMTALGAV